MIELGPGADLFRMVGAFLWLLFLGGLAAALLIPRNPILKGLGAAIVVGVFIAGPLQHAVERKQAREAYISKRDKAMAHFAERCKGAGEFIHRTVDGVDGLFVGKIPVHRYDQANQYAPDVYNRDLTGDDYIRSFLMGRNADGAGIWAGHIDPGNPLKDSDGRMVPDVVVRPGYRWIEGIDPKDGQRYRYAGEFELLSGAKTAVDMIVKRHPPGDPPRYAIEKIDISTPADRALWVAGGALRVIDLETNEIVAERIGFMVDRAQGSTAGARSPWNAAVVNACPPFPIDRKFQGGNAIPSFQARFFVERVLKIKGDKQ